MRECRPPEARSSKYGNNNHCRSKQGVVKSDKRIFRTPTSKKIEHSTACQRDNESFSGLANKDNDSKLLNKEHNQQVNKARYVYISPYVYIISNDHINSEM